ncbi:hypothetical protein [Undibacterium sp. RuRC25W]|uniref:hypothetical protein n=1 Tax=Undibacterium sp. RuRC25W TaxID=3413047 RepID=UPI003BF3BA39
MGFGLGNLLQEVIGGANPVEHQFDQIAQGSPAELLSQGLATMFHSDQTAPFAQMAGQLFGQGNADQQAGMLNHLLSSMGPQVLSAIEGGAGGSALSNLLTQLGGATTSVTPEQAAQISPEQVQQLAEHAHQQDAGIVEHMSDFYAQHSGLIKTLGGAALTIALSKMADAQKGS